MVGRKLDKQSPGIFLKEGETRKGGTGGRETGGVSNRVWRTTTILFPNNTISLLFVPVCLSLRLPSLSLQSFVVQTSSQPPSLSNKVVSLLTGPALISK